MFKRLLIDDLQFSVKDKRKKQTLSKAIRNNPFFSKFSDDYDCFKAGKIKPITHSGQMRIAETQKRSWDISCRASSPKDDYGQPYQSWSCKSVHIRYKDIAGLKSRERLLWNGPCRGELGKHLQPGFDTIFNGY